MDQKRFQFSLLLIVLGTILMSCGDLPRRSDRVLGNDGEEYLIYDEAKYKASLIPELEIHSVLPTFSNVEFIREKSTYQRTECRFLLAVNNLYVYSLKDLVLKTVIIIDQNDAVLPVEDLEIIMLEKKYKHQRVVVPGDQDGFLVLAPSKTILKEGDPFDLAAHGHANYEITCRLKKPAVVGERLQGIIVFTDQKDRATIVKTDFTDVTQWQKDWGK